ncbi:peptide chain release factor N(5)-glutamine methyltransferase [Alteromonas sp. KUL49]|uniref:peptide chain release factor N(5)-glutamine methyltransferase n=1 Tax=Alteromonas sp. KUL49 TaxID=2480798 RepID=UPI00102F1AC9|nr:peptide chain release factor N(5)-glutamine methyltransferase [Alteromonas sp. KUL49]TAP40306.1 peptide chain release factor N(5)-glutamine methyltransferase [Alteromonas sp. KUL49]GEA11446.1 release factor glutamine methyltransferase [Alteromonas sp. KUL49]
MRIDDALAWANGELQASSSSDLDAKVLLCHVLDKPTSFLFAWPEHELDDTQKNTFIDYVKQRAKGKPVAYITGVRDFWTLTLKTSPVTLIPRPDTEVLVEQALLCASTFKSKTLDICDLGTGTGAIALALASELPTSHVLGVDFVADAVELATQNATLNRINNASFRQSNWFDSVGDAKFNLIVSNPPYVETNSPYLQQGDLRFEPDSALTSGEDGLEDIRNIIHLAPSFLVDAGALLFEHGFEQGQAVRNLFVQRGFSEVKTVQDYSGLDRVTLGYWKI